MNLEVNMEYQQKEEKRRQLISSSLILAVLSLITIQLVIFPFIFGGLSILFAILGSGSNPKIPAKGKVAIVLSSLSIVLTITLSVFAIKMIFTNPAMRQQLNATSMQIYGESFDDAFEKSFGIELPPAEVK